MSWTDERVELLKKMWSDGQSASQIAKELGGVTRNAVIGKVHRLGLSNRTAGAAPTPAPGKPEAKDKPAAAAPKVEAKPKPTPRTEPARPAAAAPAAEAQPALFTHGLAAGGTARRVDEVDQRREAFGDGASCRHVIVLPRLHASRKRGRARAMASKPPPP